MGEKIRIGLIGAGMMGAEHLMNLKLFPQAEIVALSDPVPEQIAWGLAVLGKEYESRVKTSADHRDLVKDTSIDALVLSSHNHTHAAILDDVWGSGKHVLCEKPMATTLKDAWRVLDRAQRHRGVFWVGMEYRYMPPVADFITRLDGGAVGPLRMLAIREHRFPFLKKVGDWNRFSANTGGTMVEKCCHFFDLMRRIVKSKPVRVMCSGAMDVNHQDERYWGRKPDIIDNAYAIVDFDSGARAMLDLCMFAEGSANQEEIAAVGDKAKLEVFIPDGRVVLSPRVPLGQPKPVETFHIGVDEAAMQAGSHHGATYYQTKAFLEAVEAGRAPEVTAEDGLMAVAIGLAAEISAREHRVVPMADLGL